MMFIIGIRNEYDGILIFMNKFIMMIGIPGSGKSTYAEKVAQIEDAVVISSDKLREEMFGDVWEMRKNQLLFSKMYQYAFKYLSEGKSVIIDATNINSRQRKYVLTKFKPYFKECYFVRTPLRKALSQNRNRSRNVPNYAILRMYNKLQEPTYQEGWNKINIIRNTE